MRKENKKTAIKKTAVIVTAFAMTLSSAATAWAGQSDSQSSLTQTAEEASAKYSAAKANSHAISVSGKTASYTNISVTKTGDGSGEDADFYGTNAAVFADDAAVLTVTDAEISTNGKYANAVFSYGEGTTINISDSVIKTSQRNSGGIMVTGGGTLNAENLTIRTEGGSSAAIRSDRGGGTLNVDGGSYTANGSGSPAIYSTADINVSNAKLTSGTAQAVVVEGGNTVTLTDCEVTGNNTVQNSDKSTYYQAVMLYQSMSGDAEDGEGAFTMSGGSLKSLNGDMFFVTNAAYEISLSNVEMTYANGNLLRACAAGWGTAGKNGGQVTLNAENQKLKGTVTADSVSTVNMYLTEGSEFTGTFDNKGEVYVEIDADSVWNLTGDCSITSLTCDEDSINLNGYKLTVGGEEYTEGTAAAGEAIEKAESEKSGSDKPSDNNKPADNSKPSQDQTGVPEQSNDMTPQDGSVPPEKPEGESNNVPQKPGNNTVPQGKAGRTAGSQPQQEQSVRQKNQIKYGELKSFRNL